MIAVLYYRISQSSNDLGYFRRLCHISILTNQKFLQQSIHANTVSNVNTVNKNACLGHAVTKRYTALLDEVYKQLSLQSVSDGKNAVWHDIYTSCQIIHIISALINIRIEAN